MLENIRLALDGLKTNKGRAALTMLGIIIGIAAVIAISSIGSSMIGSVNDSLQNIGTSNISVSRTAKDSNTYINGEDALISEESVEAYKARYPDIVRGVALYGGQDLVTTTDQRHNISLFITGVNADYFDVENLKLRRGRFISAQDVDQDRPVIVISEASAKQLFGKADPIGRTISVTSPSYGDQTYTIIGTWGEEENNVLMGSAMTERAYVPVTYLNALTGQDGYTDVLVRTYGNTDLNAFAGTTATFFDQYLPDNSGAVTRAESMEAQLGEVNSVLSTISLGVSVIAGISLLVGGIGVMNIMLVTVTERTREIGVRKALGATNGDIRRQFLIESMIICLIGGVIGIILGSLAGSAVGAALHQAVRPSLGAILIAVGFSLLIGLFFGSYPASRAAKMNPIDALRYE